MYSTTVDAAVVDTVKTNQVREEWCRFWQQIKNRWIKDVEVDDSCRIIGKSVQQRTISVQLNHMGFTAGSSRGTLRKTSSYIFSRESRLFRRVKIFWTLFYGVKNNKHKKGVVRSRTRLFMIQCTIPQTIFPRNVDVKDKRYNHLREIRLAFFRTIFS